LERRRNEGGTRLERGKEAGKNKKTTYLNTSEFMSVFAKENGLLKIRSVYIGKNEI